MKEQKKKIMIVEDDVFVMDIYVTKLSQVGFEVVEASDGAEALKKLKSDPQKPDMILLDIIMPNMDGITALKKIRSEEEFKKIPIILLSNLSQKEKIEESFGLGAQDYLIKSHFTPSEVLEKINKYI